MTTESDFDRERRRQYERIDAAHTEPEPRTCHYGKCLEPVHFVLGTTIPLFEDDHGNTYCSERHMQFQIELDHPRPRVGDPWLRHTDRVDADR